MPIFFNYVSVVRADKNTRKITIGTNTGNKPEEVTSMNRCNFRFLNNTGEVRLPKTTKPRRFDHGERFVATVGNYVYWVRLLSFKREEIWGEVEVELLRKRSVAGNSIRPGVKPESLFLETVLFSYQYETSCPLTDVEIHSWGNGSFEPSFLYVEPEDSNASLRLSNLCKTATRAIIAEVLKAEATDKEPLLEYQRGVLA